jgi:hypothetical protein
MNPSIKAYKAALQKKFPGEIFVFPYKDKTAIMHRGLYKGSYNDVMNAPRKDYEIRVGNKRIDTRKAMTSDLFDAFIDYCQQEKIDPLPYSPDPKEDGYWLWAMLTGEPLTAGGHVQIRFIRGGQVNRDIDYPDGGGRGLRVCPAVVVDALPSEFSTSSDVSSLSSDTDNHASITSEVASIQANTEALAMNTEALDRLSDLMVKVFKL